MRCVPRTAILLPRRSLLAIARTLLHIHTLLRREIFSQRYGRTHPSERVSTLGLILTIGRVSLVGSLVGPSRPADFGEGIFAGVPHDRA